MSQLWAEQSVCYGNRRMIYFSVTHLLQSRRDTATGDRY